MIQKIVSEMHSTSCVNDVTTFEVDGMVWDIKYWISQHEVNLRIQSEYRKIRIRNNSVFGHFSRSVVFGCKENTYDLHFKPQYQEKIFDFVVFLSLFHCFQAKIIDLVNYSWWNPLWESRIMSFPIKIDGWLCMWIAAMLPCWMVFLLIWLAYFNLRSVSRFKLLVQE